MTSIAIYGAIVATISLLVSGATFLRDRARVRFFAWLTDPQGTYRIWDTECCAPWRHVSRHRQPTVLPWRTFPAWLVARLVTRTNPDSHCTVPGGTFLTRWKLAYVLD